MSAFKLNLADLQFVLRQIKISEANSTAHAGNAAQDLEAIYVDANGNVVPPGTEGAFLAIPDPHVPAGVRTVDGRYNNLVDGREEWGAANTPMPRLFGDNYINDGDGDVMSFGPGGTVTNNNYGVTNGMPTNPMLPGGNGGHSGNVADADPRTISNLVVDMSMRNPAAILAALTFAGSEDPMADLNEILAARVTQAEADAALAAANDALADANAALDDAVITYTTNPGNLPPDALIDLIQEAAEAVSLAEAAAVQATLVAANPSAALIALAEEKGLQFENGSLLIPNVAPDEGLSAPFNAWMTFFGQFFDHGLDLISKGGNGTVYIPLANDDPLVLGADGVSGTSDDLPSHLRFMAITRSTTVEGESGVDTQRNVTTSFVDQNQTYTSHASHQVFLREYKMVGDPAVPVATGKLLGGADGGLATWADVKKQASEKLGITLVDSDVFAVPLLRTDAYGEFIRGPNGYPQLVVGLGGDGIPNTADDIVISASSTTTIATTNAVRTNNAFLDDIAHNAVPTPMVDHDRNPATPRVAVLPDADTDTGNAIPVNMFGVATTYDNELLDRHYITGDGRGNENIGLTAVHHIFHSEHNRQVDQQRVTVLQSGDRDFIDEWLVTDLTDTQFAALTGMSPADLLIYASTLNWDGERSFQAARFATEMQYQHLVFEEFGRKIQPTIDPFVFNNITDVDPSIFAEFANVVYRFGHSMLTENMPRLDANGNPMDVSLGLVESFLNPVLFDNDGGISHDEGAAAIVRGMTIERGNEIDEFITGALRNNLLGLPLDLAAINIARGRDTGMPTLNQARQQLFDASGSSFLTPYTSWTEFAANLKNPISVVNFIAAYGKHASITSATTLEAKRDAAWLLVFGGDDAPADRLDFVNSTGAWSASNTGLNDIDLWIGGLAEKKMPFGGMLGSTFNAVFELQMENLQDGDRFYYLTRTQGQNFLNSLEQNSFAKMIMANTSLAQAGADGIRGTADDIIERHIGVDSFAAYDFVLEVDPTKQADYDPTNASASGRDPTGTDAALEAMGLGKVVRDDPGTASADANYIRFTGGEHIVVGGTNNNDTIITDFGDDGIWGDAGDDRIESGAGVDLVNGGAGNDIITDSGDSGDFLKGDEGDDVIANSNGLDIIMGGDGQDVVFVGVDMTEVFGGQGNDFILGGDDADFLMGNEGDDWLEAGGGFDTTAGDNSELFFNSAIKGHDVMFSGNDEHDFDAESGDDIMVQGESVIRNEGMFGFDWSIWKGVSFGANADLRVPIFTTEQADILRNRFDKVEALSGWNHNDILRGDDRVNDAVPPGATVGTTEGVFFNDELTQDGVNRIEGLRSLLGNLIATAPANATAEQLEALVAFNQGNILLGGGGSDTLQGNGGNDFIDGDAWLNVRIRLTGAGESNTAANQLGTIDSMKHVFTQAEVTAWAAAQPLQADKDAVMSWSGKSLFELLLTRTIVPNQMHIVREIVEDDGVGDTDVAIFNDAFFDDNGAPNYTVVANADGTITITHVNVTVGAIDPLTGQNIVSDGVDTLRNVEKARFADGTEISLIAPKLQLNGFDQTTQNWADNFNTRVYTRNDGTSTFNGAWVETLDTGSPTDGTIQVTAGGNLTFSTGNANNSAITRSLNLSGASSATVNFSITDVGVTAVPLLPFLGDDERIVFEFAADGVNFVSLLTYNGNDPGAKSVTLPTNIPFSANASIRFRAENSLDGGESFSIDNLSINATFTTVAAVPSVNHSTTFSENGTAQSIGSLPDIVDPGAAIASARIVLTNAQAGDQLTVTGLNGTGITAATVAAGGQIVLTLTGPASQQAFERAIQAVSFSNTSDNPSTVARIIETTVSNGVLNSNVATTTVNVVAVNDAPNAVGDNVVTNITGAITIPQWMMLRNDTDAEGAELTVTGATENDTGFSITFNSDRSVTATRTNTGNHDFTYAISDGALTDTADVDITWDTAGAINGTGGADIILGDGASSSILSGAGADLIVAGAGNDNIDGGTGDDEIIWYVGDDRDFVNGGANTDTIRIVGNSSAETYNIHTRAAWLAIAGNTAAQINGATEIVITRGGTNAASIITELDNIEEIVVNGGGGGDTFVTAGNFGTTSLALNTITINGGAGDDTVNFAALSSAHRIVFRSNGGDDTIIGNVRPQDVIELAPGQSIANYALTNNGNGTSTFSNGTHSITFTGAVPPQFQNGPVSGPQLDDDLIETLQDLIANGDPRDSSGYGNNEADPSMSNAGGQFIRLTDAFYTDGERGIRSTGLTPREISDILSNQDNNGDGAEEIIPNAFGGTSLLTFFGQYFDHGLDFVAKGANGVEQIGSATFPIGAQRSNIVPGTGVNGIPAEYVNNVSPYIDQNQAYGSHDSVTDLLRKWEMDGGQKKQTAYLLTGDIDDGGRALLPTLNHIRENYRIMTGGQEITSADISNYDNTGQSLLIDFIPVFSSPGVLDLDAIGHYFVTGDGRTNENVMLTSMHTIWARNHNFWVDRLKGETDNEWTEEQYFEAARMMNIAEYQRVVFTEFATAMAGGFDNDDEHGFTGYDPTVDASISIEFSQAAYRFGHSMLNETVSYVDENGDLQEISLVEAFLSPNKVGEIGIDALLAGSAQVKHQAIDVDVVNALRNQLVGRPLDLAALNIFRGRDMGIAPFNDVRTQLYADTGLNSLRPYAGWEDFAARNDISADTLAKLKLAYPQGFATMDLWIGGLLEKPAAGQLGTTFGYIFLEQLDRLQHGDRFYYLNIFDDSLFAGENDVTFAQIIARNTGLTDLPPNVFDLDASNAPADDDDSIFNNDDDEDEDDDNTGNEDDDEDEDDDDDVDNDDEDDDDVDNDDDEDDDVDNDDEDDDDVDNEDDDEDDDETDNEDDDDGPVIDGVVRTGTPAADTLLGTAQDDNIVAGGGDDVVVAGEGNDSISAGEGNDFVHAGGGRDVIFGGAGNDEVFAGAGNDILYGDAGVDRLFGDAGNDLIKAGDGDDTVFGGEGDDIILATLSDGNDVYFGDEGIDTLDMSAITSDINVLLGNGPLQNGQAFSSLSGLDTLWSIENVNTGIGNDKITAGTTVNVMNGGAGNDTFIFNTTQAANGDKIVGFQPGDRIDLSGIDANQTSGGNQEFSATILSGGAFTAAGQLSIAYENRDGVDVTVLRGNVDGNMDADFELQIEGHHALDNQNLIR